MLKKLYYAYWYRVRKNSKFFYYLPNALSLLIPRFVFRMQRKHILNHLYALPEEEQEYIKERVDYYCKLTDSKPIPPDSPEIGQHILKNKKGGSVYFFDSREIVRYFPKHLKWLFRPGDITDVSEYPAIVKSRPICKDQGNENSVVINMDKVRHFTFIDDPVPWREKKNKVIFRGACHGKPNRQLFIEKFYHHPLCDLKDSSTNSINPVDWQVKKETSMYDHIYYKFIMALEGNEVASNLKWVMSSNCLAVSPKLNYETWFMEGKLIPGYHFVEVESDFSDFQEKINYYISHPEEAEAIINHAHEYVAQFQNKKRERLIALLVMDKYFRMTN